MATGNGAPLLNGGSSIDSPHAGATAEGARPPPTPAEEAAAASSSTGQIPRLSRTRLIPTEAEEADTTLQLGEFTAVPTLSHSEVKFLLDAVMAQRKSEAGGGKVGQTETLTKTMDYLKVFARFNTRESIMAVERVLGGYEGRFESFERSQLGEFGGGRSPWPSSRSDENGANNMANNNTATLCPTDGDEAFTLIPSLRPKFSDAEMDEITKQITNLKTFE